MQKHFFQSATGDSFFLSQLTPQTHPATAGQACDCTTLFLHHLTPCVCLLLDTHTIASSLLTEGSRMLECPSVLFLLFFPVIGNNHKAPSPKTSAHCYLTKVIKADDRQERIPTCYSQTNSHDVVCIAQHQSHASCYWAVGRVQKLLEGTNTFLSS